MPYKNKEQKAQWQRKKNKARRNILIESLGGICSDCRKSEPHVKLEFDHIIPGEKSFTIGKNLSRAWHLLQAEAEKCHLLCHDCHLNKTYDDIPF